MLRQSQSLCTDTECYDRAGTVATTAGVGEEDSCGSSYMFVVTMLFLAVSFLIMLFRPNTLGSKNSYRRNEDNDQDDGNDQRQQAPEAH